jgi:hypothetical protein
MSSSSRETIVAARRSVVGSGIFSMINPAYRHSG